MLSLGCQGENPQKKARAFIERDEAERRGPMTLKAACDRWWNEHGSNLRDTKVKSVLDRLVEIVGPRTYLHAITDDDVSRMVEARRQDMRRDRTVTDRTGTVEDLRAAMEATAPREINPPKRIEKKEQGE